MHFSLSLIPLPVNTSFACPIGGTPLSSLKESDSLFQAVIYKSVFYTFQITIQGLVVEGTVARI